jgi:hypothetical protein
MTVLNFMLAEEAVYILSDTIVSDPATMDPITFTSKVYPAPHWEGLICGTGIMQFVTEWYLRAITTIVAQDIVHLDQFTPRTASQLFEKYKTSAGRKATSTLYHFGFDRIESRFVGFAYRSTNDFASERLPYAIGIKPNPGNPDLEIKSFPDDFIRLAQLQKQLDDTKPAAERVGVGGHLIAYMLQRVDTNGLRHEIQTTIRRCYEFPDYSAAYVKACSKLPANSQTS